MKRVSIAGGIDLATGALILGGAGFLAAAIVLVVGLLAPPRSGEPAATISVPATPLPTPGGRPAAALPADRVATVLSLDAGSGAGGATHAGDHIDVLGYFPRQVTGTDSTTRVLLRDVPVLGVDRSGSSVALTLAVPRESALLLQEAQALGARPYVTLRGVQPLADMPSTFSDADLAGRMASGGH